MKVTKTTVSFILMAVMILFMAQQAHALKGTATAEGTLLDALTVKDAAGTKLYGTVAIFNSEEVVTNEEGSSITIPTIHFIVRLSQGYRLYAFSGTASGDDVEYDNVEGQFARVMAYIRTVAVPRIFPDADLNPDTDILLKSSDMLGEDDVFAFDSYCGDCAQFQFAILDVVIAVKR